MLYVTVLCFPIFIGGLSRQLAPSTRRVAMPQGLRNSRATPIDPGGARCATGGATPVVKGANSQTSPPIKKGQLQNVMGWCVLLYMTVCSFPIFIGELSRQFAPSTRRVAMPQGLRNSRATPIDPGGARCATGGATPVVKGANSQTSPPIKKGQLQNVMGWCVLLYMTVCSCPIFIGELSRRKEPPT